MSKSKIEQEAEEYAHDSFNPDNDWYSYAGCVEDYIAGAQKLAELLKRRTEIVEGEIYTEEVIPLSALREIMGEKE